MKLKNKNIKDFFFWYNIKGKNYWKFCIIKKIKKFFWYDIK